MVSPETDRTKSHLGEGVSVGTVPDHFASHLRAVYDLGVHPLGESGGECEGD